MTYVTPINTAETMTKQDRKDIRAYVLGHRDTERYRITSQGNVEAYGRMPNSIETGWWHVGYVEEVLRRITGNY